MFKKLIQGAKEATNFYITRSMWGAAPAKATTKHEPGRITIHHTATMNNDSLDMAARMRQMQYYHQYNLGWNDIGYHYCIGQDGKVYEGRPIRVQGAHVGGHNYGNIGVSFIGNYDKELPSEKMVEIAVRLLRAICELYKIKPETILAHRDYEPGNNCPGDSLYKYLNKIRGKI